jgi:hypothetical protein
VDFLQSTQLVVNQVRLPNQMYYSGKIFTYRLDRTTVTVGAPRILAMSTSPASTGLSSWASVAVGSSATATADSVIPSATGASASVAPRVLLRWGLGCGWLQPALPPYPSCLHPLGLRGRKAESPASNRISSSAYTTSGHKYSTTLLKEVTSWDVVSVTLSFLATRLRAMLRGFLSGAGKLASRLVGGS